MSPTGRLMNILAWLILGAITGDIVAYIAGPKRGRHYTRHIALGTAAALVCGYLAGLVVGIKDPVLGSLEPAALVVAVLAAVLAITAQTAWLGRRMRRLAGNKPPRG
jgi:uncharacterized membrane protein YeaQ/YmgE (transglycosylase-associated protein family)